MRRLLLISFAALALAGCKGKCRQLSEKLCDCYLTTTDKNACLTRAADNDGKYPPTTSDDETCAALLDTCDCHLTDTPEGKVRCGIARPLEGSDAGT
jgi:hypothetical protein